MASFRWAAYGIFATIFLSNSVTSYLQLDLNKYEKFVDSTKGMLGKLACYYLETESCLQYLVKDTVDDPRLIGYWLYLLNFTMAETSHFAALSSWNYITNITKYNTEFLSNVSMVSGQYGLEMKKEARKIVQDGLDVRTKRMLKFALIGAELKDPDKRRTLQQTTSNMQTIYNTGKVCPPGQPSGNEEGCLPLEPDLSEIMAHKRDYDELKRAWVGWRDAVGPKIGQLYPTYVSLKNEGAHGGGYDSYTDELFEKYEDPNFEDVVDKLWQEVKPMYRQLHAYVRRRLTDQYGQDKVDPRAPIPAHLFGNMWAQQWNNIYDVVEPHRGRGTMDVTDTMKKQGWTVQKMFHVANSFFKSLGLDEMPPSFWTESMFERPSGREVACHGSASDLAEYRDVRIKMCTEVNMEDLGTVHHEMGHCEYYLQYSKQPVIFRGGANPGFHEAVGDTIGLSVVTPSYLHEIGLRDNDQIDREQEINYLMKVALDKIAFLPFGLLIDKWRWQVFRGQITPQEYNEKWWELRRGYQGIVPPVERSSSDFDPGAKYHIPSGTPYIRYFVSFLVQFQFQEALCKAANNAGPLHLCNIHNSKEAGAKLKSMLEMGQSRPWPEAMEVLTGTPHIDTTSIKRYFKPLMDWLELQNDGKWIGWDDELEIFHRNVY